MKRKKERNFDLDAETIKDFLEFLKLLPKSANALNEKIKKMIEEEDES